MSDKSIILLFVSVGSIVGSFVPNLWGASFFSLISIFTGALGGFFGIWVAYKFVIN